MEHPSESISWDRNGSLQVVLTVCNRRLIGRPQEGVLLLQVAGPFYVRLASGHLRTVVDVAVTIDKGAKYKVLGEMKH